MDIKPARRRRPGFPGWFAPILGGVLGIVMGIYTAIVNRQELEIGNVNREEIQLPLVFLSGMIGVLAGLILWCCDLLLGRNKNHQGAQEQPLQRISVHTNERASYGFRPKYEVCPLQQSPSQVSAPFCTMKRVGGRLISLCIGALLLGRLIVALSFPEFSGGGLTWAKLVVLIPIWSAGLIGIVMLIVGTMLGRANAKKKESL